MRLDNSVLLVTGQKGAGKTTFARHLLTLTDRAIVLDIRGHDYDYGILTHSYMAAESYLLDRWHDRFRVICRFRNDAEYLGLLQLVVALQENDEFNQPDRWQPVTVFLEEIDTFSSSHSCEREVEYLYKYGRHHGINLIGVVRADTETHPNIRRNSDVIVALRQFKLSSDFQKYFENHERLATLETLTPEMEPELGRHFLTYPPNVNVIELFNGSLDTPSQDR